MNAATLVLKSWNYCNVPADLRLDAL